MLLGPLLPFYIVFFMLVAFASLHFSFPPPFSPHCPIPCSYPYTYTYLLHLLLSPALSDPIPTLSLIPYPFLLLPSPALYLSLLSLLFSLLPSIPTSHPFPFPFSHSLPLFLFLSFFSYICTFFLCSFYSSPSFCSFYPPRNT